MRQEEEQGVSAQEADRAVVNGAASVSTVPASIPDADYSHYTIDDYDYDLGDCHNCGGEGFVYGCSWDWQCDTWDGDSCLCTRPCEWCHPPKPDPELAAILAQGIAAGTDETSQKAQPEGQKPGGEAMRPTDTARGL